MARRGPFEPWEGSFEPNFGEIRIPRPPRRFWVGLGVIASVIALLLIARPIIDFLANLTWYQALGLAPVFTTRVEMQWGLFFAGLLIAMAYFVVNIWIALKLRSGPALRALGIKGRSRFRTVAGAVSLGVALVLAVLLGAALGSSWEQFALYIHQTPSGSPDPILGMNVSFYILALPMLEAATAWLLGLTFLTALLVAILYVWKGETFDLRLSPRSLGHLSATVGPLGLTLAAQTWLGRYDLLSAHNGFVWGAGYTDVHIRMGLMTFATVVLVLSATGLIANYWVRRLWLPILAVGVWIIMGIVGAAVPSLVQKWVVAPSEQGQEKTFINYQIAGTRQAFDLNKVTVQNYPYQQQLTADQVTADQATIDNLRLWDDRPLTDTYNQLQSIRTYYTFNQINLDRYTINGKYQQLEISARELDTTKLPAAPTWQSQHLIYTHGYGVAASPVSAVVGQGEPDYVSSDIPPTGPLTVTQPALYFGQKSDNYVLAPSRTPEFDYPQGSNDQYTSYKGTHGVPMTDGNKLLWSLELNDLNLLISSEIQPKTELLFRRDVQDRISEVAPFLTLDQSPYMVVSDGKLYWVQDAYTTASSYPYSQQEQLGPNGTVNYIRNSVKIVMDAYEGSMSFYVSDPTDPIIKAYEATFPTLFQPLATMPAGLQLHIRYPQDLFNLQATTYATYHVLNPSVFYINEDAWSIPTEQLSPTAPLTTVSPYYVMMRLPGQASVEYLQIMPFTAYQKQNMISWLAVRNDGPSYGQLVAYQLPKDQNILGPGQIANQIQSNPDVSASFTLLNSNGSRVIEGNLLVVPIGNTFLYFEPIYLTAQSSQTALPLLKKVIVADASNVEYSDTLAQALQALTNSAGTTPTPTSPTQPSPTTSTLVQLVNDALTHANQAQTDLTNGDLGGYASENAKEAADVKQIQQLIAASPGPTTPATPATSPTAKP